MKKAVAFILVLAAITSILTACTPSDVSNNSENNTLSENSFETSTQTSSKNEMSDEISDDKSSETSSDGIVSIINNNLDIILADFPESFFLHNTKESTLAEIFPGEFSAIVDLGEEAFPILDSICNDSNNTLTRRAMARYAKYIINPDLVDLSFPSPDGKYSIKCSVYSFAPVYSSGGVIYGDFRLVDETSGSTIAISNIEAASFHILWSLDGKLAAISYGFERFYYKTDIFDVLNGTFVEMPGTDEIQDSLNSNKGETASCFHAYFEDWVSDNKIKINVFMNYGKAKRSGGWYTYDLTTLKIVDGQISNSEK